MVLFELFRRGDTQLDLVFLAVCFQSRLHMELDRAQFLRIAADHVPDVCILDVERIVYFGLAEAV